MMGFSVIFRVALLTLCVTLAMSWPRWPARRRPALGRFPLDKACRTVGPNNVTLSANGCPGCGTCSNGPFRTRVNNTVITAFFCRYRNPLRNIQQKACLVQNDGTNAVIKMRTCGLQQQCTLGPVYMKLPNITSGRLYLCESKEPNVQRRPITSRQRQQPNVDLFQIMVNESCRMINTSANTVTQKSCCQNCSTDPVIITMDNHRLQLFGCLDDISNFTGIPGRKPARPIWPRWGRGGGQGGRFGGLGGRLGGMMGGYGGLGGMMGGYGGQRGGQRRPPVRVGPARRRAGPARPRG